MSDLISRKSLMEHIRKDGIKCKDEYYAEQVLHEIEYFPSAFDLDKVIKELEKEKEKYSGGVIPISELWAGEYIGIKKAIEIINKYLSATAEPPKTG